jgi:uncharacterized membrane protein YphA (DoxX/SURF4 family)
MNKMHKNIENFSRLSLATVFIWFGFLKIIGLSPANQLIQDLLTMTLSFIPFDFFIIFLGFWEVLIGILFLMPKLTKPAFYLMLIQMFTTFGPLLFLPQASWQSFMVPTLAGQYILKNLVLVALGLQLTYQNRQ